jgi:vacuolar-type H+-ATPase subunit E/Vma4
MDCASRLKTELAPLETALLSEARAAAAERVRTAEERAGALDQQSASRAEAILKQAAAEGEGAAERAAAHRLVQARRQARTVRLQAERAAYDRLLAESIKAVQALRGRPEYQELERRRTELAKLLLGPEATIVANPGGQGGVEGRKGSRRVDLTLPVLVRRCVARLGAGVTKLWS